jgi:4-amino-4-deoxy-L-arabinose transferase-like glycosyltransferase
VPNEFSKTSPDSPVAPETVRHGRRVAFSFAALLLLAAMAVMAGGAALRESVTVDEVAHIAAGVSYLQRLDLRLNEEHPPLPKILAALPLVLRGVHADYTHISWTFSETFIQAYAGQWVFGEWFLTQWNSPGPILAWARLPMLILTLALGWLIFVYGRRFGGDWGGLLCVAIYASTPTFIAFGPLVHTDISVTLFSLLTLWAFADIWREPDRKNITIFALALACALLSKFTAGILFFVFGIFALSTRWRPIAGQPRAKPESRKWRRTRWKSTFRGIFWAAIAVYAFYFIFSLREPTDVLNRVGHGNGFAVLLLRRLLMPPWLYLRGVGLVLASSSRPTFLLGHAYTHGVWFYFPVLFVLKSPLGFLALLLLSALIALFRKRFNRTAPAVIPANIQIHWRVLRTALFVFTGFCLSSRLDISIRHFSIPIAILIIFLAPLPQMLQRFHRFAPVSGRLLQGLALVFVASSLFIAIRTYPYYFPFVNSLGMGRPAYALVNDSNLDWDQSLPEAKRFAENHGLRKMNLDNFGLADPAPFVPQAISWDCQSATAADAGQWVIVSAGMILDGHNCGWLMQYPTEKLAGGSMYAVQLPHQIPPAGSPGGPPLPSAYRMFGGGTFDMRTFFLGVDRNPASLPAVFNQMMATYNTAANQ